ncbi:hypothetical protein [Luteibacter yeojuensis]|uniref:DUF4412 domain-containing protein n=1 Tax=Luteibacter yeojuensis TaxID=345309 RepID=A0A7X5TNS7_9GAMM|nr:hypothetical protein [Luteibacter yeojuensis]NID13999.1 hypothetical protein [Luteibacter yeojuensis]
MAHAAEEKSYTVSAIGVGDGYRYVSKEEGRRGTAFTIRQKGERIRVDIDAGSHHGTTWGDGKTSWMVVDDQPVALPLGGKASPKPIVYDLDAPCTRMLATCSHAEGKMLLGHRAAGWAYRNAGGRGPDGTDSGTLWIDKETGVLLEMRGEDVGRRHYEWRATAVSFEPIPDGIFALPAGVQKMKGAPKPMKR